MRNARSACPGVISCSFARAPRAALRCMRRASSGVASVDPTAEHVRRDVGRRVAVDAPHHEERRAEPLRVELDPAHVGHGHVGAGAHELHALRLQLDVVLGEHRVDLGHRREPGDVALGLLAAERHLEQHGLARHPVAGRRLASHTVASGPSVARAHSVSRLRPRPRSRRHGVSSSIGSSLICFPLGVHNAGAANSPPAYASSATVLRVRPGT